MARPHPAGGRRSWPRVGFCTVAIVSEWGKASSRVENANLVDLTLALAAIAAYYLIFILGWIRILDAWGIKIGYRVALQAEMVSMLAKYVPGGVWTPAARTVALRRTAGVTETATVLASILLEAVLSAVSGVIVLVVSLAWVRGVDAPSGAAAHLRAAVLVPAPPAASFAGSRGGS